MRPRSQTSTGVLNPLDAIAGVGLPFGGARRADALAEKHTAAEAAALARARWRDVSAELLVAHAQAEAAGARLARIDSDLMPVLVRAEQLASTHVEYGEKTVVEWIDTRVAIVELDHDVRRI